MSMILALIFCVQTHTLREPIAEIESPVIEVLRVLETPVRTRSHEMVIHEFFNRFGYVEWQSSNLIWRLIYLRNYPAEPKEPPQREIS